MMEQKNLVFGIIAGALVGAGAALLFAPKSGEDMRYTLKSGASSSASSLTETLKSKGREMKSSTEELVELAKEITPVVKEAIGVVQEWKGMLTDAKVELTGEVNKLKASSSDSSLTKGPTVM
ncbi:YtxH domain-containing protein [Paenibacillus hunanensis]|uniref:YtxH domain-containing protein n=1 Tax=Paenibacillus hunanensis TaxID=539262 RepID=UPI002025F533|nr:YtxH domain-containing protein [Paenibacillus hunanensis]MCL9661050.1 YtxH domain-containing protein [Paenibacillus hunanensis]